MTYVKVVPEVPVKPFHRIWIDDEREPEGKDWYDVWAKNFSQFREVLKVIEERGEKIDHVSFDYVLEGDPNWPRPYEKNGLHCVEVLYGVDHLLEADAILEGHSRDSDYNKEIRERIVMFFDNVEVK
jgi:hypothetical protein